MIALYTKTWSYNPTPYSIQSFNDKELFILVTIDLLYVADFLYIFNAVVFKFIL